MAVEHRLGARAGLGRGAEDRREVDQLARVGARDVVQGQGGGSVTALAAAGADQPGPAVLAVEQSLRAVGGLDPATVPQLADGGVAAAQQQVGPSVDGLRDEPPVQDRAAGQVARRAVRLADHEVAAVDGGDRAVTGRELGQPLAVDDDVVGQYRIGPRRVDGQDVHDPRTARRPAVLRGEHRAADRQPGGADGGDPGVRVAP